MVEETCAVKIRRLEELKEEDILNIHSILKISKSLEEVSVAGGFLDRSGLLVTLKTSSSSMILLKRR